MKSKVLILIILLVPLLYVCVCNRKSRIENSSSVLPESLSAFNLFEGDMSLLKPAKGVQLYELSSVLFTDYAEKQRLTKLPPGKKVRITGDGLPVFPEGTILAKTFFYSRSKDSNRVGRQIIETRILQLTKGKWIAGTYRWNRTHKDAHFTADEVEVPVNFMTNKGNFRQIKYKIPSTNDCISCHQSGEDIIPIGPKAMNLNKPILAHSGLVNQLEDFERKGLFKLDKDISSILKLPDYSDNSIPLEQRSRAYLEINCAHCHNPTGWASQKSILLNYAAPLQMTNISVRRNDILGRMKTSGQFHMPKLGTTIIDNEGLAMIEKYLSSLPK